MATVESATPANDLTGVKNRRGKIKSLWNKNKELIQEWGEMSSLHGIPHVASSTTTKACIIWLIIFFACLIAFLVLFMRILIDYLEYPTVISFESHYDETDFPAVTLCHSSAYSRSKINSSNLQHLKNLINAYETLNN